MELKWELIEQQMGALKEKVDNVIKRVDNMEWIREAVTKTNTIMEMMLEDRKQEKKIIEKQSKILNQLSSAMIKVNENLSVLNNEMKLIKKQVEHLENKVEENELKNKIDIREFTKKAITYLVTAGMGGYLYYYFLLK